MYKLLFSVAMMCAPSTFAAISCGSGVTENPTGGPLGTNTNIVLNGCLSTDTDNGGPGLITGYPSTTSAYISWLVEWQAAENRYKYSYKFFHNASGGGNPAISHAILGLSENCTTVGTTSSSCIWGLTTNTTGTIRDDWSATSGNGNPGFPAGTTIQGIKIEGEGVFGLNPTEFSFYSLRIPVWQNFYGKAGNDVGMYNAGLTGAGNFFIVAPDSVRVPDVPEPGFYGVLASGLGALLYARQRIRRRNDTANEIVNG